MDEVEIRELCGALRKLANSRPFRAFESEAMNSIIGTITVHACEFGVLSVDFGNQADHEPIISYLQSNDAIVRNRMTNFSEKQNCGETELAKRFVKEAVRQMNEYFSGERLEFTVPLVYEGTVFQKEVWQALAEIPYGETRTYADIATKIGRPKAVRAVGQANHANPIAIMIPCHRVIGSGGSLVGYAGSRVELKSALLELEFRVSSGCA